MKKTLAQKPSESPDGRYLHIDSDSENPCVHGLFDRLNLYRPELLEPLKNFIALTKPGQSDNTVVPLDNYFPHVDKPENEPDHTLFSGPNLLSPDVVEQLKNFCSQSESSPPQKPAKDDFVPIKPSSPEINLSKISTTDVITSLLRVKKNKLTKESTLATYKKRLQLFQQQFTFLPENPEAIIDYLSRFDGESGRHPLNHQDLLNMLYLHATRRFGLLKNPVAELERPIVTRKPVKTLSLEQIRALNQTPENLLERTALDLLLGHGWRQIELRRVRAKDTAAIDHLLILCHGKERQELAPLLPETADRFREMATDLEPGDFLFVAQQTRRGHRAPLGEDGMSQLIGRLLARAGIKGFTGHDLRRTFATVVTTASHDEFLAMRLIRDRVPGLGERYIRYPMAQLVEALQKYSPVRQAGKGLPKGNDAGADSQKVSTVLESSPVSEAGEALEMVRWRLSKDLVETGESRTPRPEEAVQGMLQV